MRWIRWSQRAGLSWLSGMAGSPRARTTIDTKVMVVFEIDANGQIKQMRESFDMKSLTDQIEAAGFHVPG